MGDTDGNREMAQDGKDITGSTATLTALGGWGIRGWLSALYTLQAHANFHVHLDIENLGAAKGYMLVDLSDITNWPHTLTSEIHLDSFNITVVGNAAFRGDIELGFLSNVDADNGDFNIIAGWHSDLKETGIFDASRDYKKGIILATGYWFGPTTANNATWQTDVNLTGPDGATSYPSGNGDLVMNVALTAGNVDVGLSLVYHTK